MAHYVITTETTETVSSDWNDQDGAVSEYEYDHPGSVVTDIRPATVRETLVAQYGDRWESVMSHVVSVAERRETTQTTDNGYPRLSFDYIPVIVIANTCGRNVWGYEEPVTVANYRVLRDQWSDVDGLSDGPYDGSSDIALDLDSVAPVDLIDVLDGLADYPVISDDEWSTVEQEFIQEHWESYGLSDTLDTVAKAIGADSSLDLTDYATELVTELTFSGAIGQLGNGSEYPSMIDSSAVEFGSEVVAQWIRARLGLVVPVRHYGRGFTAYLNPRNLIAA